MSIGCAGVSPLSKTSDTNLDGVFVKNTLVLVVFHNKNKAPNSIFFCLFLVKKSLICLEGKSMIPSFSHFSLPFLPSTPSSPTQALLPELQRYKDTRQVYCTRRADPRTPSMTT